MPWPAVVIRVTLIVVYFVGVSVWAPSALLRTDWIASATAGVRDLVAVLSWGSAVAVGIVGLRIGQRRGWL